MMNDMRYTIVWRGARRGAGFSAGRRRGAGPLAAFCLLAACLLAGGCSKDEAAEPGGGKGKVALSFTVDGFGEEGFVSPAAGTKAALEYQTTVRIVAYRSGMEPSQESYVTEQTYFWDRSALVPCTVDEQGANPQPVSGQSLMLEAGSYDIYALTPAIALADDKVTLAVPLSNGVDYAFSKTTAQVPEPTLANRNMTLTLNTLQRQCGLLSLILDVCEGYELGSLSISGMPDPGSVRLGEQLTPVSGSSYFMFSKDQLFEGSDGSYSKEVFILPQRGDVSVVVNGLYNGVPSTQSAKMIDIEVPSRYILLLWLKVRPEGNGNELVVTEVISDDVWDVKNMTTTGGHSYPYVLDGHTVVTNDQFGCMRDTPFHAPWWGATPAHKEPNFNTNNSRMNSVSSRFRVSKSVWRVTSSNPPTNMGSTCASLTEGGFGGWRVPTLAEAFLICRSINSLAGTTGVGAANLLVSATQCNDGWYWTNGAQSTWRNEAAYLSANDSYFLCVRDFNF